MDKPSLYVPSSVQIEMKIGHGGLKVVMTQAVFDLGDVFAPEEEIDGPGVPEGVHGVDMLQPFRG